jgi:hypothetical protein
MILNNIMCSRTTHRYIHSHTIETNNTTPIIPLVLTKKVSFIGVIEYEKNNDEQIQECTTSTSCNTNKKSTNNKPIITSNNNKTTKQQQISKSIEQLSTEMASMVIFDSTSYRPKRHYATRKKNRRITLFRFDSIDSSRNKFISIHDLLSNNVIIPSNNNTDDDVFLAFHQLEIKIKQIVDKWTNQLQKAQGMKVSGTILFLLVMISIPLLVLYKTEFNKSRNKLKQSIEEIQSLLNQHPLFDHFHKYYGGKFIVGLDETQFITSFTHSASLYDMNVWPSYQVLVCYVELPSSSSLLQPPPLFPLHNSHLSSRFNVIKIDNGCLVENV